MLLKLMQSDGTQLSGGFRLSRRQWLRSTETTSMTDQDPDRSGFELVLDLLATFNIVRGATKSTKAEKLLVLWYKKRP